MPPFWDGLSLSRLVGPMLHAALTCWQGNEVSAEGDLLTTHQYRLTSFGSGGMWPDWCQN